MEEKTLVCPVCQGTRAEIAGKDVRLGGRPEDGGSLPSPLTVLRCTRCGYFMFFDGAAKFAARDEPPTE